MTIGEFKSRIVFQAEQKTPDGGGGHTLSWSSVLTVWGDFTPERGSERLAAGRLQSQLAGTLKIRASSEMDAITTAHRAVIDGENWAIHSISNPDQRGKFLEMSIERSQL